MIHFKCSNCGFKIKAPDNCTGRKGRCPKCHQAVEVPARPEEQLGADEAEAIRGPSADRPVGPEVPTSASEEVECSPPLPQQGAGRASLTSSQHALIAAGIVVIFFGTMVAVLPLWDLALGSTYPLRMLLWIVTGVCLVGVPCAAVLYSRRNNASMPPRSVPLLLFLATMASMFLVVAVLLNRGLAYCLGFAVVALLLVFMAKAAQHGSLLLILAPAVLCVPLLCVGYLPFKAMNVTARVLDRRHRFGEAFDSYRQVVAVEPDASLAEGSDRFSFAPLRKATVFLGYEGKDELVQSPYGCEAYLAAEFLADRPENVRYLVVTDTIQVGPFGGGAHAMLRIYTWPEGTRVFATEVGLGSEVSPMLFFVRVSGAQPILNQIARQVDDLLAMLPIHSHEVRFNSLERSSDYRGYAESYRVQDVIYRGFADALTKVIGETD